MENIREEKRITKEYLLDLLTQAKVMEKNIEQLRTEKKIWDERTKLAESKGKQELFEAAKSKSNEISSSMQSIAKSYQELGREIRQAKLELKGLEGLPELSIDPETLLESLEGMGGKVDPLKEEFETTEAESELDKLKKEMGLE